MVNGGLVVMSSLIKGLEILWLNSYIRKFVDDPKSAAVPLTFSS